LLAAGSTRSASGQASGNRSDTLHPVINIDHAVTANKTFDLNKTHSIYFYPDRAVHKSSKAISPLAYDPTVFQLALYT
jgi:hypothetical protein